MIFVTGASGLVGNAIVQQLLDDNQSVRILLNHGTQPHRLFSKEACQHLDMIFGHPTAFEEYDHWIKNVHTIIHCDALSPYDTHKKSTLFRHHYGITKDLINHCLSLSNPPRFIHINHIEDLGHSPTVTTLDETSRPSDIARNTHYATSQHMAAMEVYRGQLEGLDTLTFHLAHILDPSLLTTLLKQSRSATPSNYHHRFLSYVDIRDVASVVNMAIKQKINAKNVILSSDSVSLASFLDETKKINPSEISTPPFKKRSMTLWDDIIYFVSQLFGAKKASVMQTLFTPTKYNNTLSKKLFNLNHHTMSETLAYTTKISKKNTMKPS